VDGMGGWAQLSTMLASHRTANSLTLVCGDFLGGSALAEHHKGRNVTALMEHLRTDVVVIGNQSVVVMA
jgi:2',3'-cyclic-nucleotide 2'-phosphodiesterase (5'-nucleotidase family)